MSVILLELIKELRQRRRSAQLPVGMQKDKVRLRRTCEK
jgi:hypothetical protein